MRRGIAIVFAAGLLVASSGSAPAFGATSGVKDHGTIKISELEDPVDPSNDPHVRCPFRVDFFGLKDGTYDLTFTGWPPTGGGVLLTDVLTIGSDEHGNTWQASRTYDLGEQLADVTPHPQQGYHVRLDAKRRGTPGQGSKTKVFWLTCAASVGGGGGGGGGGVIIPPGGGGRSAGGTEVLGKTVTRTQATEVLGSLATTGAPVRALLHLGVLFLGAGLLLLRKGRAERLLG